MLAEWDARDLHKKAFDMSYAWSLHDTLVDVNKGRKDASGVYLHFAHALSIPAFGYKVLVKQH